jgi:hypothetical protein
MQQTDTLIFATCRQPESATELNTLAATQPERVKVLPMDVTSPQSIATSRLQVEKQV